MQVKARNSDFAHARSAGALRQRKHRDRTKYTRKKKHKARDERA